MTLIKFQTSSGKMVRFKARHQRRHIRKTKFGIVVAGRRQSLHYNKINNAFNFGKNTDEHNPLVLAERFNLNKRETFELYAKMKNEGLL